ncbi:MAG: DUF1127 domain-containing protein [Pseudomonadota bacterium]
MAYADTVAQGGFFSRFFSTPEERKAMRAKRALYHRQRRELMRMTDRELLDLGYCRIDLEQKLHRHHFGD